MSIAEGKKYRLRSDFVFSEHELAEGTWIRIVEISYPIAYCIAYTKNCDVTLEINIQRLSPLLDLSSEEDDFGFCDFCNGSLTYQPYRALNIGYLCDECAEKLGTRKWK